jgi:hypothetical protein
LQSELKKANGAVPTTNEKAQAYRDNSSSEPTFMDREQLIQWLWAYLNDGEAYLAASREHSSILTGFRESRGSWMTFSANFGPDRGFSPSFQTMSRSYESK